MGRKNGDRLEKVKRNIDDIEENLNEFVENFDKSKRGHTPSNAGIRGQFKGKELNPEQEAQMEKLGKSRQKEGK